MADFCAQCSVEIFGEDCGDLANLVMNIDTRDGAVALGLCEECGPIYVSRQGQCVDQACLKHSPEIRAQHGRQAHDKEAHLCPEKNGCAGRGAAMTWTSQDGPHRLLRWLFAQLWEHRLREDDNSGRHLRVLRVKGIRTALVRNRWGQHSTVTFL